MTEAEEIMWLKSEVAWRDKRIKRLEEITEDLAGEVDRLWGHAASDRKCPGCGGSIRLIHEDSFRCVECECRFEETGLIAA